MTIAIKEHLFASPASGGKHKINHIIWDKTAIKCNRLGGKREKLQCMLCLVDRCLPLKSLYLCN
jgi:hypothetical protein